jgi:hypothetical protein
MTQTTTEQQMEPASSHAENSTALDNSIMFLSTSIADVQGTIRHLDAKVNYLMVVLATPFLKLEAIYQKCLFLLNLPNPWLVCTYAVLVSGFALSWALASWTSLQALAAIDNPEKRVSGDRPGGIFYAATLFKLRFIDAFFNRRVESEYESNAHLEAIPETQAEIQSELALEHMKLVFIRCIKLHRVRYAYLFCRAWIALGGVLWLSWLHFK